jgi:DNA polymerase
MLQLEKNADSLVAGYLDWWNSAGVDYIVGDDPHDWLAKTSAIRTDSSLPQLATPVEKVEVVRSQTDANWPGHLELLVQMITESKGLPGTDFGGRCIAPAGALDASLMIITDFPDTEAIEAGKLTAGPLGLLLNNMLSMIGQTVDLCYITALAFTRPATGALPDEALPQLVQFARHQIDLLKPAHILILGSVACKALLGAELLAARGNLHYFNHDGQKVTAITTFHPRTLLARPILKAQAWQDLQMLNPKGAL